MILANDMFCGGEYSDASGTVQLDWTNTCEIYDPVQDTWSSFDRVDRRQPRDHSRIGN